MWLVGVLSLMLLVGGILGFLARDWTTPAHAADFDMHSLTASYAGITAPLAGFSVAAAVFFANITRGQQTPFFVDVMALFLFAFIMLMGTAIIYATFRGASLRSLPEGSGEVHYMLVLVCNTIFYMSLSVSWLGLRPLLLSIGFSQLADVFTWVLLFTVLAGAIRLGSWLHTLLGVRFVASVLIPVVSIAAPIAYGLFLAPRSDLLWPTANPVLSLAILVFAIGAAGGGVENAMISLYGQWEFHRLLLRFGKPLIVPYVSSAIIAISLLWFSIASK